MSSETVEVAADALFAAWRDRAPLASLSPWIAEGDVARAYAVQRALHERFLAHGRRQIGWKIGVTSPAALAAMGAREPMVGMIYADSLIENGGRFDPAQGCASKLEGELLVELGNPATGLAVTSVRPAFEIADSRIAGWATSIAPAIADNACGGWLVMAADGHPVTGFDDLAVEMTMTLDGRPVSHGRGADCFGGAFSAARWFLDHARSRGLAVSAGQWLLTGAIGPGVATPAVGAAQVVLSTLGGVDLAIGQA